MNAAFEQRRPSSKRTVTAPSPDRVVGAEGMDAVDVWGVDSFPASDPPSNW